MIRRLNSRVFRHLALLDEKDRAVERAWIQIGVNHWADECMSHFHMSTRRQASGYLERWNDDPKSLHNN